MHCVVVLVPVPYQDLPFLDTYIPSHLVSGGSGIFLKNVYKLCVILISLCCLCCSQMLKDTLMRPILFDSSPVCITCANSLTPKCLF